MTDPNATTGDIDELREEFLTELFVLRTAFGVVIPYLGV
jgi:hypothetical protein